MKRRLRVPRTKSEVPIYEQQRGGDLHDAAVPQPHPATAEGRALEFVQRDEGRPLEPAAHTFFESRFGHTFADIQVHRTGDAGRVADDLHAKAFTVGSHIVLNPGQCPPESLEGQAVLAHELAHAVQNERVDPRGSAEPAGLPARSAAGDPAEADARRAASAVLAGRSAQVSAAPGALIAAQPQSSAAADERQAAKEEWLFEHKDVDWGATEKEKKPMRTGLAYQPTRAGGRELALGHEGRAALSELSLFDPTRAEGGARVKEFERAYAVFRLPMQMTLDGLGRVQDLLTAGAPQTPREMSKAQKGVFHRLGRGGRDSARKDVFGRWADRTSDLNKAMDNYMGVYQRLQGALLQWRSMKERILIKQKKAQLKQDTTKLAKLEAPAKTIVAVIGAFQGGLSAYESFKPEAVAPTEPDMDVARAEVESDIDFRTGAQKGVSRAGQVKGLAQKGAGAVGGAVGISMESVIQWAMGDSDEIAGLKASIDRLKQEIEAADERAEDFAIDAAATSLQGTSKESRAAALGVSTERTKSREAAEIFAGVMGDKSVDARLLTLCAEAYQELRMFGEKALEAYGPVAATLPAVKRLVSQPGHQYEIQLTRQQRRADMESLMAGGSGGFAYSDYEALMDAAGTAQTYGALLQKEYPKWAQRALQWEAFFGRMTGGMRLDEYGAQRAKLKQ